MYAHIDCNNFFVSCERLFRPDLENKPVAVLSNNDSCLISRSAEVKALGIAMAAPLYQVQNTVKASGVELFSANFELYGDISERIVLLLQEITPLVEVYSIDECFLDLSRLGIANLSTWAKNVQKRIRKEIGVPVSIGVGKTKTLAKTATNYAKKHDGVAVINSEKARRTVLENLPVGDVWGIGYRTAPKLKNTGISNAWQLVNTSDSWLKQYFDTGGMRLVSELRGVSCLQFGDKRDKRKSIGVSRTFGHKIRQYHQLESAAASFATRAAARLRRQDSVCSRVVIHLTTSRFDEKVRSVTKSRRLAEATADTGTIIAAATDLLSELYDPDFSYAKVMVLLLDITDVKSWQLSLTDPSPDRDKRAGLMKNIDVLNQRFGPGTVWYAAEDKRRADWQSRHARKSPRYTTSWAELPTVKT